MFCFLINSLHGLLERLQPSVSETTGTWEQVGTQQRLLPKTMLVSIMLAQCLNTLCHDVLFNYLFILHPSVHLFVLAYEEE